MSENVIELPESLTIHHIEAEFGNLKIAFQSDASEIKISAGKVDAIDTSGLQALLSLIKTADKQEKTISWDSAPEVLTAGASKLGIAEKLHLPS